jgi:hypothetical protein
MQIKTISDFRQFMRNGKYTDLGGYPLYFLTSDGCALSFKAAKQNCRNILESMSSRLNDGWCIVAVDVNWENDQLFCDHSGERIESAYGEDE